jgi:hypothetical protein
MSQGSVVHEGDYEYLTKNLMILIFATVTLKKEHNSNDLPGRL